jgi:hypothetical protein
VWSAGDAGSTSFPCSTRRLTFGFRGRRHFLCFGPVSQAQAEILAHEARDLSGRVRTGQLALPESMNIATFLTFGGVVLVGYRRPWEPTDRDV